MEVSPAFTGISHRKLVLGTWVNKAPGDSLQGCPTPSSLPSVEASSRSLDRECNSRYIGLCHRGVKASEGAMVLSYRLHRAVSIVVTVCILGLLASVAGAAPNPDGPTRSTTAQLDEKRYVAAGDRAYVIGSEDGRFPPMGWHIRGEMGGVWAHPIKLLDGYWFSVDGQWLPAASRFTTGAGYVQMNFPNTAGLEVTRTEFSPDGSPVTLTGLTLRNPGSTSRSFKLNMDTRSEIMAAYPWGWTTPSAKEFNGHDEGSYDASTRTLTFQEPD